MDFRKTYLAIVGKVDEGACHEARLGSLITVACGGSWSVYKHEEEAGEKSQCRQKK